MMGYYGWGNMMGGWSLLAFLTWVALVVFLVLGSIYFWNGIKKKR